MIVALTGTPGVGKSTAARILRERGYDVESVSELAEKFDCITGEVKGSKIVDVNTLADKIEREGLRIIEGHLSHHLNPDIAIVLRCNPKILKKRLSRKGWAEEKILENLEAEITDVILLEAMDIKKVCEIDTTKMRAEEVANAQEEEIKNEEPAVE